MDSPMMKTMLHLILLTISFQVIFAKVIQSPSGPIEGFTVTTFTGKEVDAYFNVPYAKPPIGERRFQKPEPVEPWTEVLQANKFPNSCPSPANYRFMDDSEMSEDCLYLTIAVPKTDEKKLPVFVRMHGGGYCGGSVSAEWGNSTTFVAEENVIVVAMNYRLGALGFLHLGSPGLEGNYGLWDQNMAIKWVKENIEAFGGDPDSITLIGESAGAASVQFHTLSDESKPFFNRAIMESGMALSPWALSNKIAEQMSKQLAEKVGCKGSEPEEVKSCLKKVDMWEIVNRTEEIKLDGLVQMKFAPVVDGEFLKEDPKVLMEKGSFKKGDYLFGSTVNEGIMFAEFFLADYDMEKKPEISRKDLRRMASYMIPDNDTLIVDVAEYIYTNWTNPELEKNLWSSADNLLGDYYFICPDTDFADMATKHGSNVYRHVFAEPITDWTNKTRASHAAQVGFVYGIVFNKNSTYFPYVPKFEETSRRIMRSRANFARTGDPNKSPDGTSELSWPQYSLDNKEYLLVKAEADTVGYGYRDNFCAFWRELKGKLEKQRENCKA